MSLLSATERLASVDRSEVVFGSGRCLHSQDRFSECELCFTVCPVDAITAGEPPQLDAKLCAQCMACLPVCPTGAYSADDDVAALLSAVGHIEEGAVELLCERNPRSEMGAENTTGIRIHHCLASLGVGAYVALIALDIEGVQVRCDACAECEWGALSALIAEQVTNANQFLSSWTSSPFVEVIEAVDDAAERPLWSADNPPVSRREMFRMLANRSQTFVARAMENGVTHGERRPGRDRLRLNSAVEHLAEWQTGDNAGLGELHFTSVQVSEDCSACEACAKACPTQALIFKTDMNRTQFTLQFQASHCVDCGLCAHVCSSGAISYRPAARLEDIFTEEPIILASGDLMKCSHCGIIMAKRPDTDLCPVCAYRIENPFGSKLPPVVQAVLDKRLKDRAA